MIPRRQAVMPPSPGSATAACLPLRPRLPAPQTDIRMPKRHLRLLEDVYFNSRFQQAIEAAVQASARAAHLPAAFPAAATAT